MHVKQNFFSQKFLSIFYRESDKKSTILNKKRRVDCEKNMIFGHGISRMGEIVDYAVELDIIKKSGAWFSFNDMRIGQGRENTKKFLEENEDIRLEIEEKIFANSQQINNDMLPEESEEDEAPVIGKASEMAEKAEEKPAPKKSKAKKSVVVDADDDFEEFSMDEIGG